MFRISGRIRRRLIATLAAALLSACAELPIAQPSTESSTPTKDPSPRVSSTVSAPSESGIKVTTEFITDELGTYQRITALDRGAVSWELTWSGGTTESDLVDQAGVDVRDWILSFVLNEALDSIALDNPNGWAKWKQEVAPKYIAANSMKRVLEGDCNPIIRDIEGTTEIVDAVPTLARNSKSRLFDKHVSYVHLSTYQEQLRIFVIAQVNTKFYAEISDDEYVAWTLANTSWNGEWSDEGIAQATEAIRAQPQYSDGKPEFLSAESMLNYTLTKDVGTWQISDCYTDWGLRSLETWVDK